jgi:hypothetical protein
VKPEETAVAGQRLGKHMSPAMDTHAIIEEILEAVFYMSSVPTPSGRVRQSWLGVAAMRNCAMVPTTT